LQTKIQFVNHRERTGDVNIACSFYEKLKDWYKVIPFIAFAKPFFNFNNMTIGFVDRLAAP
jgi:hypothetical protein